MEPNELKKPSALQFRHNCGDGFVAGYEKEEMDKYLSEVDWNDVSNTKIPLNEEIFALLEDRMDPEKLRPAVIVAKMMPAKRLTWTENKEGDVLCYDVPAGNFHSCNGAHIKYWKHVNVPSKQAAKHIAELKSDNADLHDDKKLTDAILDERNAEIAELKAAYDEVRGLLQNTTLIKDEQKAKADKLLSCLKCLVMRGRIKDCPEKDSAIEIVMEYDLLVERSRTVLERHKYKGELKMFKDELIALQAKANPRKDISSIVAEFKETIRSCVKDGFCKDNKMSFPIVNGRIDCKNPLYHEPTCYIEDLSAVEKAFKKEGIDMDWSYDWTHLNGTLTFKW